MKTMKELRNESSDYRALYHLNYWDGPLSGGALFKKSLKINGLW